MVVERTTWSLCIERHSSVTLDAHHHSSVTLAGEAG
jgi:hypothetical protein